MSFSNKVIWITGASSGIGEALAIELSRHGAQVVLSARRPVELERVRQKLVWPDRHLVLPLDVTRPDTLEEAFQQVLQRYGHLDVLVNNSGVTQRSKVIDTEFEVDRRIFEVNYFGAVALAKVVLPHFLQNRRGQYVVISSLVGELPTPYRSAYSASKHALHGWFETLRAEEHDQGIKVLMVMPGFVRTNVSYNALTGTGEAHGVMDPHQDKGMEPAACAEKIVRAMQSGRATVIIAGLEGAGIWIKRWIPALYRWVIRRVKVT